MNTSKRFGKFAMLFLFLLTCLGSSIPVSAEAEEEPEVVLHRTVCMGMTGFHSHIITDGDSHLQGWQLQWLRLY